jgi:hypothetical protein
MVNTEIFAYYKFRTKAISTSRKGVKQLIERPPQRRESIHPEVFAQVEAPSDVPSSDATLPLVRSAFKVPVWFLNVNTMEREGQDCCLCSL